MRRRSRAGLLLASVSGLLLISAPAAQATFHEIKVREVFPSSGDGSYVVLQMYNAGQNLVGGHAMKVYDTAGAVAHTSTIPANVANDENQRSVMIGDAGAATATGVTPDYVDASLSIPAAGGAVCWNAGGVPADCVAWGNFNGGGSFDTATGTSVGTPASASGITPAKAIRRKITGGCATLLESGDDSNNSATDFEEVTPAPHNNAATPIESSCAGLPNTTIGTASVPAAPARTKSTSATFTYSATPSAGASFECNLDEGGFAGCPANYESVAEGEHEFEVRAVNGTGADSTPAVFHWFVDLTAPSTVIDNPTPPSPNGGTSVVFKYHASEASPTFECSLVKGAAADSFADCGSTSTKNYKGLLTGTYTFKVLAIDQAGNKGAPTSFSLEVDNTLADTTPPNTTISSSPPNPSSSTTATFTYASDEAESTFTCRLDGGALSPCAAGGVTYSGLAAGPHTFEVAATDSSANTDKSPAGYSFDVVLPIIEPPAQIKPPAQPPAPSPAAPDTTITSKPKAKTSDRTPTFKFKSSIAGATYECKLDGKPLKPCRSPLTTKSLSFGRHTLRVAALAGGLADPSPASSSFKVVKPK